MKKLFLTFYILTFAGIGMTQDWAWVRSGGDGGSERAMCTVVDTAGYVYTTGYFQGNFTIGGVTLVNAGSSNDAFISKHDRLGNLIWAVNAGGSGSNSTAAYGIDIDPAGNIYITGSFTGSANFGGNTVSSAGGTDMFIAKYDNAGNGIWARRGGGSSTIIGRSIAVDSLGNPHVCGNFYNTATIGSTSISSAGQEDMFVCKYSTDGTFQWARDGNGSGRDYATSVVVDTAGNVTIGGYGGGGTNITFDSQSIGVGGAWDIVLAQYDSGGTIRWVRRAGGSANDVLYGMDLDPAGNIYCTGIIRNTANFNGMTVTAVNYYDVFLAKYDVDGIIQFVVNTGGSGDDRGQAIHVNDAGESYVAGYFLSNITIAGQLYNSNGASDICVIKYDNLGNEVWGIATGGSSGHDYGRGIAVSEELGTEHVYVCGFYQGTVAFGPNTISSVSGSRDAFLGKLCTDSALCSTPLPLSFGHFEVEAAQSGENVLEWTTSWEMNSSHFVIERSRFGEHFEAIGEVPASGNSDFARQYRFEDHLAHPGRNYYRIRQIDQNGDFSFSSVQMVTSPGGSANLLLYPNPSSGEEILTIQILLPSGQDGTLRVFDMAGRSMFSSKVETGTSEFVIPPGTLPAGMYLLEYTDAGIRYSKPIVIQAK